MKKKLTFLRSIRRYRNKNPDKNNNTVETNNQSETIRLNSETLEDKISRLIEKHTKRHLVVDDIDTNRETLSYFLSKQGITTHQATNGAEAVEIVSRYPPDYFDVVWMDVKMPFMDGIGATSILRDRDYNNIIIMITGHINRETLLKCKMEGADKIYSKPILKDQLYNMDIFNIYH